MIVGALNALEVGLIVGLAGPLVAASLGYLNYRFARSVDARTKADAERQAAAHAAEEAARGTAAAQTVRLAQANAVVDQYRVLAQDSQDRANAADERNRKSWVEWHAAREADLALHRAELKESARRERAAAEREAECERRNAVLEGRVEELDERVNALSTAIRRAGLPPVDGEPA